MPIPALLGAALPYLIPALVSAGTGGLAALFSGNKKPGEGNAFTGFGSQTEQLPRFTGQQQSALNQLLQQGLSNSNPQAMEQYAKNQFNQEVIPSLAERFAQTGGRATSPAFASQLGQAGANLSTNLGALRSQFGMQQLGLGLSPSFENIYIPQSQGAAGNILSQLNQLGPVLGMLLQQNQPSSGQLPGSSPLYQGK